MTAVILLYKQTCFDFLSTWQPVSAIPKGHWMPAAVNWGASVSAKPTLWDAAVTPALQAAMASASTAAMVSTWQPPPEPVPGPGSSCIPQVFRALNPWLCVKQYKKYFHKCWIFHPRCLHCRWAVSAMSRLVGIRSGHSFAVGVFQHVSAILKARWARCVTRWRGSAPAARRWMASAAADAWLGTLGFPTVVLVCVMALQSFVIQWLVCAWAAGGLQLEATVKGKLMGRAAGPTQTLVLWNICVPGAHLHPHKFIHDLNWKHIPKPRIKLGLAAEWQVPIGLANACRNACACNVCGGTAGTACMQHCNKLPARRHLRHGCRGTLSLCVTYSDLWQLLNCQGANLMLNTHFNTCSYLWGA